jgi:hypothetical protein
MVSPAPQQFGDDMLIWAVRIGAILLLGYWISGATTLPMFWTTGAVAAMYIYFAYPGLRGASGAHGAHATGGGHGVAGTIGGALHGATRTLKGLLVFTAIMMIATRFMQVSNNYAFTEFMKLGWRFWLWPQGIYLDVILWTAVAFLVAGIAEKTANGQRGMAVGIFSVSALIIFVMMWMPMTGEMARPKPSKALPATATAWQEADATASEEGVIPVAVGTTTKFLFGEKWRRFLPWGGKKDATPVVVNQPQAMNTPAVNTMPEDPEWPSAGIGVAKKGVGIQAWMDTSPSGTETVQSAPVRYVLESNPAIYFDDMEVGGKVDREARKAWRKLPTGRYIVYPIGDDDVEFRWWK